MVGLIVFPVILQTAINLIMLSIGEQGCRATRKKSTTEWHLQQKVQSHKV